MPQHHLSAEGKDAVKLAMGLVATVTALLLGLLVSSAKASCDTARGEVIQMAAKVALLDRVLALYGPEAASARLRFGEATEGAIAQIPSNATATLALLVSALSVSGAIFLVLELDRPFGGLIRLSSEPLLNALHQPAN